MTDQRDGVSLPSLALYSIWDAWRKLTIGVPENDPPLLELCITNGLLSLTFVGEVVVVTIPAENCAPRGGLSSLQAKDSSNLSLILCESVTRLALLYQVGLPQASQEALATLQCRAY